MLPACRNAARRAILWLHVRFEEIGTNWPVTKLAETGALVREPSRRFVVLGFLRWLNYAAPVGVGAGKQHLNRKGTPGKPGALHDSAEDQLCLPYTPSQVEVMDVGSLALLA
jgi:hypothetical protein